MRGDNVEENLDTQKNILRSARQLFIKNGFHETSMSDVAKKADVGKGTLYWHFSSKKELFIDVIKEEGKKNVSELREILKGDEPPDKKLKRFITYSIDKIIKKKDETQMFLNNEYYIDQDFKDAVLNSFFSVVEEVDQIIKAGIEEEVFTNRDTKKTSIAVIGAINFMGTLIWDEEKMEREKIIDFLYSFIADGIISNQGRV